MAAPRKTHYKRSTPVIRLLRNVDKLERHAHLILDRLSSWIADGSDVLVPAIEHTSNVMQDIIDLKADVTALGDGGFAPPKRSFVVVFVVGQKVAIAPKHREKYAVAFKMLLARDPSYLDELVIVEFLPSREILVRRGSHTPFIVRKSHLVAV